MGDGEGGVVVGGLHVLLGMVEDGLVVVRIGDEEEEVGRDSHVVAYEDDASMVAGNFLC